MSATTASRAREGRTAKNKTKNNHENLGKARGHRWDDSATRLVQLERELENAKLEILELNEKLDRDTAKITKTQPEILQNIRELIEHKYRFYTAENQKRC